MADGGFLHDDGEFGDALAIVATQRGVGEALVEKDYWIIHTLWALVEAGLTVSFKGGTSLSKGFGLIRRFSEDLDVKIESPGLPAVPDWESTSKTAGLARRAYFVALGERLQVPGAQVEEDPALRDEAWRSATFKVTYPKRSAGTLPAVMRPYVQLEVGSARIRPGQPRPLTSWLHELVEEQGRLGTDFIANLPGDVHCVSPHVTLLEKIEAGKDILLIIDEAQNLTFEVLEQLRLLSNLETDKQKLLQIILLGQPETAVIVESLLAMLADPKEESGRVRHRIAEVAASRRWELGGHAEGIEARPIPNHTVQSGRLLAT